MCILIFNVVKLLLYATCVKVISDEFMGHHVAEKRDAFPQYPAPPVSQHKVTQMRLQGQVQNGLVACVSPTIRSSFCSK